MISSTNNPIIKNIKKLISSSKYRREMGFFVVEGLRNVEEVPLENIDSIFCLKGSMDTHLREGKFTNVNAIQLTKNVMKAISSTKSPQGIVALCKMPKLMEFLPNKDDFVMVLDRVNDPGNLGTIIRTCRASGVDYLVLLKGSVDLYNDKVVRASMGAIFNQNIITGVDIDFVLERLSSPVYAAVLENAEVYHEVDLSAGACVVLGNEANGVSEEVLEKVKKGITIPMENACESLNLGVSASVLAFEVKRQRDIRKNI